MLGRIHPVVIGAVGLGAAAGLADVASDGNATTATKVGTVLGLGVLGAGVGRSMGRELATSNLVRRSIAVRFNPGAPPAVAWKVPPLRSVVTNVARSLPDSVPAHRRRAVAERVLDVRTRAVAGSPAHRIAAAAMTARMLEPALATTGGALGLGIGTLGATLLP